MKDDTSKSQSAARFRQDGLWLDRTINSYLAEAVARTPGKVAIVADRVDRPGAPRRFTYREVEDLVGRTAHGLRSRGIARGDVVSVQLPNWWEYMIAALACDRLGAVLNPLMPIFRERELSFMLALGKTKLLIVPRVFRGFDYAAMAAALRPSLPDLAHVIVVDGEGEDSFERALLGGSETIPSAGPKPQREEDELSLVMFTSGTTGEPKGVMHTPNTFMRAVDGLAERFELTADDVSHVASPMGHMIGYLSAAMIAIRLGATAVLQDVWNGRDGLALMEREGVTYMAGSTPFLADICDAVASGSAPPARFRKFLCAGAPIPPVLVERAATDVHLQVCSVWGLTESLSATATEPSRSREKSFTTDGRPTGGMEIRVVDDNGALLPARQTGFLHVRGASMSTGYYKRPGLLKLDADGWFDTGDLAYIDDEGYVRIAGRLKDLLIRGGEKVPVVEIENLLYKHPSIAAAAIVGYPDLRLGERACAFVELRPGASVDLKEVQTYLSDLKVTKHYWPEIIEIVETLPRTPSGKIQKFKLKELAAEAGGRRPPAGS